MIEDAARLAETPAHRVVIDCVEAGIEAARPRNAIRNVVDFDCDRLTVAGATYDLDEYDEVLLVGGGKAGGAVAVELEALLGDRIDRGAVVGSEPSDREPEPTRIEVFVGGHPLPDEGSVTGTRRVLELAEAADDRTLVLAVITGGGSAMLAAPADGIDLADLQAVTADLLAAGADIEAINAVRKHCSAIKGGGLARAARPATVVGMLVSDVVGDDPGVIASGPTAPDETTYAEARSVLDRHGVEAPASIRRRLEAGDRGEVDETPDADDPLFERVDNRVLANGWTAIEAAREVAEAAGYATCVLSTRIRGEAREAALVHVAVAEEVVATGNPIEPPAVLLSGGETTVTVRGSGTGGPNIEFALSAAIDLPDGAVLACVDTDGQDGSTDAAGALVDAGTIDDRAAARRALADNDAHEFLESRGSLLVTGSTGTNVNDLRVLYVPE